MGVLLAFAPFIAFAILERIAGALAGLAAGTAVSAILNLRDMFWLKRKPKLLEAGTFMLFAALTLYTLVATGNWSVFGVRLCVDGGLLVIVLASLATGQPFTLQYARESVPEAYWNTPSFFRTNQVITVAWAAAFAVLAAADTAIVFLPNTPKRVGVWVTIIALVAAYKFTAWYPEHARRAQAGTRTS